MAKQKDLTMSDLENAITDALCMNKILWGLEMGTLDAKNDDGDTATGVGNLKVFAAVKALELTRKVQDVFLWVKMPEPHLVAVEV
jgi:hypothetical protein